MVTAEPIFDLPTVNAEVRPHKQSLGLYPIVTGQRKNRYSRQRMIKTALYSLQIGRNHIKV